MATIQKGEIGIELTITDLDYTDIPEAVIALENLNTILVNAGYTVNVKYKDANFSVLEEESKK